MSDDKNFDKIFSEITSRENIGDMPGVINPLALNNARDYSLFMAELITAVQEINLIIVNLTEHSDEPFEIPTEVVTILESLYSKARDFNNYMINLDQDDIGYFIYIDDEEEDDNYDNDSE
jgi:hypothetical protein